MGWVDWLREVWVSVHAGQFSSLGVWSYIFIGVLVATEGPLSTLLGAAAAAAGILDPRWVLVAAVAGNVVGDTLWYAVGYTGQVERLLRSAPRLGSKLRHIERLKREMHSHAPKLLIFAKLAYGLIVPTLVAAGIARVPWRRWFPVVFVVETLWSLLLVWLGYHASGMVARLEQELAVVGAAVLVMGAAAAFWLLRRRIDRTEIEMDPWAQPLGERADSAEQSGWERLLDMDDAGFADDERKAVPVSIRRVEQEERVRQWL